MRMKLSSTESLDLSMNKLHLAHSWLANLLPQTKWYRNAQRNKLRRTHKTKCVCVLFKLWLATQMRNAANHWRICTTYQMPNKCCYYYHERWTIHIHGWREMESVREREGGRDNTKILTNGKSHTKNMGKNENGK